MKYVIVLGDGMADEPIEAAGGKTPLQLADKPVMDEMAKVSEQGIAYTVPSNLPAGSDVANLSMLGYDPQVYYSGRSPLEALSIGVDMKDTDIALRCNVVTVSEDEDYEDKTIIDHSAGEITSEEAAILIQGSWAIGQINGSCAEGFADKVGVFAFPAVTGGNPDANRVIAKSDSLCMSASTKYPEAAIALMKYFTDDTAQKYTAEVGGKIPVTSVEYDENVAPPELAYVMDVFKNASSTFGFYNESLADTEAGSTFDNCFVEIFKGEDPETALQPIQDYYEMNVW